MRISRKIPREMLPRDGSPGPTRRGAVIHPLQVRRLYPSVLMGCMMPCESVGELEHWKTLDADGDVVSARAQPDAILWNDEGVWRRHTPDAEVQFSNRRRVIREVKPLQQLNRSARQELDRRTAIVTADLAAKGIAYEVLDSTSKDFRSRLKAADELLSARCHVVQAGLNMLVREAVLLREVETVGELEQALPFACRRDFFALALRRQLTIELGSAACMAQARIRLSHHHVRESI